MSHIPTRKIPRAKAAEPKQAERSRARKLIDSVGPGALAVGGAVAVGLAVAAAAATPLLRSKKE